MTRLQRILACTFCIQCLLFTLSVSNSPGKNKNGVSPETISLPSGPGSIEGFGDAFQPMPNSGNSRYLVNIGVPAGTAGNTPEFSLHYDSGMGDGTAGIGWSAEPGSISRQVDKGIPRYVDTGNGIDDDHDGVIDEADEEDTFLSPEGEELVEVSPDVYRARIEGRFIRYRRLGETWQVDLKNGTTLEYGTTPDARVDDPADESHIYRWYLSKSTDVNGNTIEYSYASLALSDNRKYIKEIRYGPGAAPWSVFYFLHFSYEVRPDWRSDYRSGFPVKTAHRLSQIDIGIQGTLPPQCAVGDWNSDSVADALISRYRLEYTSAFPNVSHLNTITRYGADGINSLPPLRLSYATASPSENISAAGGLITGVNTPSAVMDNERVELIDLNRDGLADILHTDYTGAVHFCSLNLGSVPGDPETIQWSEQKMLTSDDGLALRLHLAEDQVNLADMNGDGIADLVYTTEAGEVYYYSNNGDLSWGDRQRMSISDTAPPAPSGSSDVITVDMDFDKRMDVVRSSESGYTVWFNRGGGYYSQKVESDGAGYPGQILLFSAAGVQTADMNGDRLEDVVQVRQNTLLYSANMGNGNFAAPVSVPIPNVLLTDGDNSQISRAKLTDVNDDGLADLLIERANANELWLWLNRGTDSLSDRYVLTDMPDITSDSTVVRWADMNGNGSTDLVYADSTAAHRLRIIDIGELLNGSAHPNLLTRIENGLGLTTDIFYKSSTDFYLDDLRAGNPWITTIPFPLQVVSEVQVRTGLDLDDVPGIDVYSKNFFYRDGFYEDRERQFRGFGEVRVVTHGDESAPSGVKVQSFFTGGPDRVDNDGDGIIDEVSPVFHREEDALKGKLRSLSLMAEDGTLFKRQENIWAVRNLLVNDDGIEIRFAGKEQSDTLLYEGQGTPEVLRSYFTYDEYGNITEEKNEGALSITGDEVYSYTQYINDSNNWLLGFVQRQYITDSNDVQAAETLNFYDGDAFTGLTAGQLTKGLLSRQQRWVGGSHYIDMVRNSYDGFGNILATLDPNGSRRSIEYDQDLHIFPLLENIEVGGGNPDLQVRASYNSGLGVVVSSLDFNGHETFYTHDVFGRPTSVIQPGDSSQFPTRTFTYQMVDPQNQLLYSYDSSGTLTLSSSTLYASSVTSRSRELSGLPGTLDTIQYVDGMGRKLAQLSENESGFVVSGAVRFNGSGTSRFRYLPYAVAQSDYVVPDVNKPATETWYDAAGRVIRKVSVADDNNVTAVQTVSFAPLSQTVTDANGITKDFIKNGLKQLIRVQEHNQGSTYLTDYQYDTLANRIRIEDAQHNIKTISYDALGRKVSMEDPDRGHMEYEYDDAGNLIRTIDNKGQVVEYTYDGAGRLLSEDYLDAAGIIPDVELHYDQASVDYPQAENLKGKLAWLRDLSGGQYVSYDKRTNPVWTVKRIVDQGMSRDYHFSREYDALGRITATIYPDNDHVEYQYNNRGLLKSIPGFVDSVSYTSSGARSAIQYHNGISTSYTYDPRERLQRLTAVSSSAPLTPVQDVGYIFDQENNILDISEYRSLAPDSPANGSQHFEYDDLYRLIQAAGGGYGQITFQYDAIGNMIFKNSPAAPAADHVDDTLINLGNMEYGGAAGTSNRSTRAPGAEPGPHAVTAAESGLAYDYDDNGNMISHGTGDLYEWDYKDRLTQVTSDAGTAQYVYDFSGSRVIKRVTVNGDTETTCYVDDSFEVRNNRQVKYVFDGSERIARVEGRLTSVGEGSTQLLDLTNGWNFISLDLEPDDPAIPAVLSSLGSAVTEVWEYDSSTEEYVAYVPAQGIDDLSQLHGHRAYLLKMAEPATLQVSGVRIDGDIPLNAGWNLIPSPAENSLSVTGAFAGLNGQYNSVWSYADGNWQNYMPEQPDFLNNLLHIHPAHGYWLDMKNSAQLHFTPQPLKIYFYHPDHLGSSSLLTDESGSVVERTQYYPFGRPRYEERSGFDSAYKYTGKELDRDTGLMYYEARYYDPVAGRFLSVDPLFSSGDQDELIQQTAYEYCDNDPILFVDPSGMITGLNLGKYVPSHFAKLARGEYSLTKGEILRRKMLKPMLKLREHLRSVLPSGHKLLKTLDKSIVDIKKATYGMDAVERVGMEVTKKLVLMAASGGMSAPAAGTASLAEAVPFIASAVMSWSDAGAVGTMAVADYYGNKKVKDAAKVVKMGVDIGGLLMSAKGTVGGQIDIARKGETLHRVVGTLSSTADTLLNAEGAVKSSIDAMKKNDKK